MLLKSCFHPGAKSKTPTQLEGQAGTQKKLLERVALAAVLFPPIFLNGCATMGPSTDPATLLDAYPKPLVSEFKRLAAATVLPPQGASQSELSANAERLAALDEVAQKLLAHTETELASDYQKTVKSTVNQLCQELVQILNCDGKEEPRLKGENLDYSIKIAVARFKEAGIKLEQKPWGGPLAFTATYSGNDVTKQIAAAGYVSRLVAARQNEQQDAMRASGYTMDQSSFARSTPASVSTYTFARGGNGGPPARDFLEVDASKLNIKNAKTILTDFAVRYDQSWDLSGGGTTAP